MLGTVLKLTRRLVLGWTSTFSLNWGLHGGGYWDNWRSLFHFNLTQHLIFIIHLLLLGL